MAVELGELSRKPGLVVRFPDSSALTDLFARLARYDTDERAETFDYLTHALNETRAAHGAEPAFNQPNRDGESRKSAD